MSAKLSKSKPIQDEFSPEQPGLINVAGEVFFMNLPGKDQTDITSRLYDDSIKGDAAFQVLFLGGLPIEDGGSNFTQKEQIDLRRIFRAIFGPRQRILPTTSQVKSLARMAIRKKGVVMPSKPPVFQLPCDDKDRDLMIKALQIRRTKLIEQIQDYDKLAIDDIHGRYMRDHLKKLNDLLDNQIIEAKKTKRGCRYTGVIDQNAPRPLALNDERMHRLLEIFAFLLAQGKDPLKALSGRLPSPSQIIPMMANADAPDIYEYEESFKKERDGKVPDYPETLLKLRKVLEGDEALRTAVTNEQMKVTIDEAERVLFPSTPSSPGASMDERKRRILARLREMDTEVNKSIAEVTGLKLKLSKAEADLAKCNGEKEDCLKKLLPLETGTERTKLIKEKAKLEETIMELGNEIIDLKEKLAAQEKKGEEKLANLREVQNLANENLRKSLQEQRRIVEEQDEKLRKCEGLPAELEAAKKEIATLKAAKDATASGSSPASSEEDKAKIASQAGQIAALEDELNRVRAELTAAKEAAVPAADSEEIKRLTDRITELEGLLESEQNKSALYLDYYTTLVSYINEILGNKVSEETKIKISDDNKDVIKEKIKTLTQKFTSLEETAASGAAALPLAEGTVICLLNAVYMLLKRIIPKIPEAIADTDGYQTLFNDVGVKARQINGIDSTSKNTSLDDAIIRMFILIKKNHTGLPNVEAGAVRLQGLNERGGDGNITEEQYKGFYQKLEKLHKITPIFSQKTREHAATILKILLNTNNEYQNYTFTNSGEVFNTGGNDFVETNIDMPSIFLYVLSLTEKTINEHSGDLQKLGCSVIPGSS